MAKKWARFCQSTFCAAQQFQVGLVHQSGRLQGVPGVLSEHVAASKATQLLMD